MIFDARTLVAIIMAASILAVLAMLFLYQGHRHEQALKHAVFALAMQCLGLLLVGLRNVAPVWLSIVVANTLVIGGIAYLLGGAGLPDNAGDLRVFHLWRQRLFPTGPGLCRDGEHFGILWRPGVLSAGGR